MQTVTTTAAAPVAQTHGLTKRFGDRAAIRGVDLRVPAGVALGLLGPNGAGKTTLIRCLLGLTKPSGGDITVMGHRIPSERKQALARVGAVVEEPRFYSHLSGDDNLRAVAALMSDAAMERIPEVLQRVGLGGRAHDRVSTYSLGMRQRLGIARCLLNDPLLLILDEPMNGLDPAGIQEFRVLIRDLVREGRTVLISSHLLDEVEKTCDAIAIIDHGRVVQQASMHDLREPAGGEVAVDCDDVDAAQAVVSRLRWVTGVTAAGATTLVCTLASGATAADLNRALVQAGIAVSRLQPATMSLEERFLDATSRLESEVSA